MELYSGLRYAQTSVISLYLVAVHPLFLALTIELKTCFPPGNGVVSLLRDEPRQIQLDRQKCDWTGSWDGTCHHRIQPVRYRKQNCPVTFPPNWITLDFQSFWLNLSSLCHCFNLLPSTLRCINSLRGKGDLHWPTRCFGEPPVQCYAQHQGPMQVHPSGSFFTFHTFILTIT